MGHHVEASTKSATVYNRDALLLVHAKIAKLVEQINSGTLKPDASRAERLSMLLREDHESDGSDSSDFEEVDLNGGHSEALVQQRATFHGEVDEYEFVSHKLSGTIHVVQSREDSKLACGRRLTLNMIDVKQTELDAATAPFCAQCSAVVKSKV